VNYLINRYILTAAILATCLIVICAQPQTAKTEAAKVPGSAVVFQSNQTLEDIASLRYGDPTVADEIRALNNIPPGQQPKAGTTLQLPGMDRKQALTALRAAKQALQKAKLDGGEHYANDKIKLATDKITQAEMALSKARYTESKKLADETWALARQASKISTAQKRNQVKFSVTVDDQGTTAVEVKKGKGVKVTAKGKTTSIKPGHAVRVEKGQEPQKQKKLLEPPTPILPNNASTLVTPSIFFSWKPVPQATRYVLVISKDAKGLKPVSELTTEKTFLLFQSNLANGKYYWFLKTVDALGMVGQDSPARSFILQTKSESGINVQPVNPKSPTQEDK
jgi:hypothetical protein